MSISILNRGASGGLKPELTVTAPSGSTIDLLQNGIIVATYTLGASETEHTFAVKVGTYTVRGTLGTKVQSKEVVIEVVGQYAVEIDYRLWLYREGDECEDITGGWNSFGANNYVVRKNSDSIYMKAVGDNNNARIVTENKIDLTNYTKICAEVSDMTYYRGRARAFFYLDAQTLVGGGFDTLTSGNGVLSAEKFADADISSVNGTYAVCLSTFAGGAYSDTYQEFSVYEMWLE